ncbi:MAG: cyclic peptide export ABC transporter [Scytonematopsis contorta HA4267-MV1]|nr:cyclic peptide export ABC transporter [Scytonematopsis contorta HA4267-MV1]
MNLILFLLRSSWVTVVAAALLGAISGASSTSVIALISDSIGKNKQPGSYLIWQFLFLVFIALTAGIFSQTVLVKLSESAIAKLRMELTGRILASPLIKLETVGSSSLLASLTVDVNSISNAIFIIPSLCVDITLFLGCLIYLSWLNLSIFLVTLIFLLIAIPTIQILYFKGESLYQKSRQEKDKLFKTFEAATIGTKELKLNRNRRRAFLKQELQAATNKLKSLNVRMMTTFAFTDALGRMLFLVTLGLLVFVLPQFIEINMQVLSAYILTFTYLMSPFERILQMLPAYSQSSVALRKIDELGLSLASESDIIAENKVQYLPFAKKIELINVKHTYHNESEESQFTVGEVNLEFYPGELIFIVGGNGSGKSTLAKIITGLYIPDAGDIYLDGKLITDGNRDEYRQLFSAIFSDFYLFERLLGLEDKDIDYLAKDYLKLLQLDKKLQINDGVFSTIELSQGQRKRLALLTAYLEDRAIYLFDEWASDQDPHFREIFYKQLLLELKQRGKTVLAISHDDRYFNLADRIIKLEYGKLI